MTARTLLITGCSSGIGLDAAQHMTARGWRVFATARQPADVDRLTAMGLEALPLDVTDPGSIAAALDQVSARAGRLDALFNNAAFAIPGALEDVPAEAMRHIFDTNLIGLHALTRAVIPMMRAQGGGRIVMCSSVLGLVGMAWRGAYVASKYALEGYSDVLRIEMAPANIHISLIEPGPITSAFRRNARAQFDRWIDWPASPRADQYRAELVPRLHAATEGKDRFELGPEAVTARLVHALESRRPRARYYVTTPTWIMGGLRRILPTRALDALIARY
ncbi:SDR family NAD(P)-dependent oxidoreductase [Paracoccus sp. p3-h83]|uniref:SDR family NAD(P)-dependent oxidoreductase n=1 Tax=Paracoccus sp. p3-h83 TaxID=3342805 RepID=UPI0035B804A6